MSQSKQNYQSDNYEYYFRKSNYMSKFLNERSKQIIEKLRLKKQE